MKRTLRPAFGAVLAFIAIVVATSAVTAANSVPASKLGEDLRLIGPNDVKPPECAGISLSTIVTNGTNANDLVLGGPAGENLRGRRGNDCILGGAGNDRLRGNRDNDVLLGQGGNDRLIGGLQSDTCYGGPGADTFASCETQIP